MALLSWASFEKQCLQLGAVGMIQLMEVETREEHQESVSSSHGLRILGRKGLTLKPSVTCIIRYKAVFSYIGYNDLRVAQKETPSSSAFGESRFTVNNNNGFNETETCYITMTQTVVWG